MKKIFFLSIIYLLLAACNGETSAPAVKPFNVVFILADDLGITDINAYARHFREEKGNRFFHETPHLDRLIREGTAFSQAYATQLCSPTRAGILAGKFAPRLGFMTAMPLRETYYNQDLPVPEGYYVHDVLDHRDKITIPRAWDNATSNSALPTGTAPDKGRDLLSLPEEKLILVFERQENAADYTAADILAGEFYKLTEDPREWNDLYDKASVAAQQEQFTKAILEQLHAM